MARSGKYRFFRKAGPAPANLSNAFVISIVEDRSGYLWFGTYGGLNRYDPRTGRFAAFRHDPADPHSLSHDIVYSLMVDHQGTLWAGTGDGLNRCEDPVTGRFRSWKAGGSPQQVAAMVEDSKRVLWLVSGTLQRFDPATGRFTAYSLDPFRKGRADQENSAALFRPGKRMENSFLTIDHSGVLWVATPDGLVRFDREREQFTMYDERDGLPASSVSGILEDRNGNLWVSTAGGLSRFNPARRPSLITTIPTAWRETPSRAIRRPANPGAVRCSSAAGADLRHFGRSRSSRSHPSRQWYSLDSPCGTSRWRPARARCSQSPSRLRRSLTLSHDQNHTFSFEFAALSYVDPPRNQYRYMLEPLDHSWNRVNADHRLATFTTLPAGNYTLRVQGSNNRGVWNEQGIALHLQILPPWWATWWFRTVCAVMLVTLLWGAWQLRIRQLLRESQQLRDVIETIPAYVWSALPDGSVDFINRRWLEFSGFSPQQALGWGWVDAVHPDDRDHFVEAWRNAFTSGQPMEAEARVRRADGQYRWLLISKRATARPDGEGCQVVRQEH